MHYSEEEKKRRYGNRHIDYAHRKKREKHPKLEKSFTLQISGKQFEKIKETSEKEGITMAAVVRNIINKHYRFK